MRRKISGSIFCLLLPILFSSNTAAQSDSASVETDAGYYAAGMRVRGPRIGYDLSSLALLYFEPERMACTFSIDYEISQDIYPAAEFGLQTVKISKPNYDYSSNGKFFRAGVDLNLLKYEKTYVYEMMYGGLRYGYSWMDHEASNILVEDALYGDFTGISIESSHYHAHFISLVGGVRVRLFNNFFMGWSVYANIKFAEAGTPQMVPYNIPGFGPGDRRAAAVLNYTISYRFPLQWYKPVKIIKREPRTGESVNIPVEE